MTTNHEKDEEYKELMSIWGKLRDIEDYARLKLGTKSSAQSTMGKLKRDLADRITDMVHERENRS